MTATTPRSSDGKALLDLSRFSSLDRRPPCLPSPHLSCRLLDDLPASLSLPVLAPRASSQPRHCSSTSTSSSSSNSTTFRREQETSASLMDFVSHMSLSDVAQSFSSSNNKSKSTSHHAYAQTVSKSSSTPDLEEEEAVCTTTTRSLQKKPPQDEHIICTATPAQWSLTTPETIKTTVTMPQGFRVLSQKRKSPLVHSTPVDGNRPLMLPSLSTVPNNDSYPHTTTASTSTNSTTTTSHYPLPQGGRSFKKPKNHKSLLRNAPMLPTSPDLEDRVLAQAPRYMSYHPPCFSPPVGRVTLVNPHCLVAAAAASTTTPSPPRRRVLTTAAAALPTLDEKDNETDEAPNKWLRMKKRTSLLCALRLAATEI